MRPVTQYIFVVSTNFLHFQMKKDYLAEGSMADTADLVVLGAYYGTGNKGIKMNGTIIII